MSTHHNLKILTEYYELLLQGVKNYELRFNDRNYQVGDLLILTEWLPNVKKYGRLSLVYKVTHVLYTEMLRPGYVILSIKIHNINNVHPAFTE